MKRAPAAVWVAVVLVLVEALAWLAAAVALAVVLVRGSQMPGAAATLMAISAGVGVALAWAARALLRGGRRWARSPVLTVQFVLGALVVAGWATTPQPAPPIVLAVAVTVVVALLTPRAVAWTVPPPRTTTG